MIKIVLQIDSYVYVITFTASTPAVHCEFTVQPAVHYNIIYHNNLL